MAAAKQDTPRLKLAAIDLDGTLLGPDVQISKENRQAVARLQDLGIETVLASGRHYDSMKRFADDLGGIRWMVSVQGAEVADIMRATVLKRDYLDPEECRRVLSLGREMDFASVIYAPEGIYTDTPRTEEFEFYARLTGRRPIQADVSDLPFERMHKIVWIGDPDRIASLKSVDELDALAVQKVHTHLRLFEFMPFDVSKAAGLDVLVQHLELAPEEVAAFGDAENDIPMFRWAGISVAMAHGWPAAIAAAQVVSPPGPPESAFARAVDRLLQ